MTSALEKSSMRPTWAEIDLEALAWNFSLVRARVAPQVKILAAVKADAYGHGAVACARRLQREGADWFGVATVEEGLELRRADVSKPILCFGGFWFGQEAACLQHEITPVIHRLDMAAALNQEARARSTAVAVHVEIDTGMGRLGIRYDQAAEFASALRQFERVHVRGLMTHFAAADLRTRDDFTRAQIARFREAVDAFRACGHQIELEHMANSAATFAHPDSHGQMVRPGGALYGMWRDVLPRDIAAPLRPVMSFHTRVMLIKEVRAGETLGYGCTFTAPRAMRVAVLPVGYHDGYARALSNCGRVIVKRRFARVVGRVSMDLTLIDVTEISNLRIGDIATLWGEQDGKTLPVEEVAREIGTISYEMTCGVSRRVPRLYLPEEGR